MACDLAIPLSFDGGDPRAFGANVAHADALIAPDFSGRVATGASCNASVLTITPHGNGTHTESVAHLTDGGPGVPLLLAEGWMPAWLASVAAESDAIPPEAISDALADAKTHNCATFILRTQPNDASKLARHYGKDNPPAFLALETAAAIAAADISHLLVDLPSLDCLDDPALPAHRAFFGLPAGSRNARDAKRRAATVTEFIYAPDEIADGLYLLDLQVPRWQLEAVPSRPLVIPAELLQEKE